MAHGQTTTKVPADLESSAMDGIVASADGVFDYVKRKTQETINQELYEAIQGASSDGEYYPE